MDTETGEVNILLWISIALCVLFILAIEMKLFGKSTKTRSKHSATSFFSLNEITDRRQFVFLSFVAAIPLCLLFAICAYNVETFGKALVKYYFEGFLGGVQEATLSDIVDVIAHVPGELYPFIILGASLLIFGAQLSFLYRKIEQAVIMASGVRGRADHLIEDIADALLRDHSYDQILDKINSARYIMLPLAEELEKENDKIKLSFQIAHLARSKAPVLGLHNAISDELGTKFPNLVSQTDSHSPTHLFGINGWHVFASATILTIVFVLYLVSAPFAAEYVNRLGVGWPQKGHLDDLFWSMISVVFATIFPAVFGFTLFCKRIEYEKDSSETFAQSLLIVLSLVFFASIFVNFLSIYRNILQVYIGEKQGTVTHLELSEWIYIITHSLVPCLAISAVAAVNHAVSADTKSMLKLPQIMAAIITMSVGHFLSQMIFEFSAGKDWNYYWHQGVLALVLSVASLATFAIFWNDPDSANETTANSS